jgi:hypothetical protein
MTRSAHPHEVQLRERVEFPAERIVQALGCDPWGIESEGGRNETDQAPGALQGTAGVVRARPGVGPRGPTGRVQGGPGYAIAPPKRGA